MIGARQRRWLILALTWAFAGFAIWPVLMHRAALAPWTSRTQFAVALGYAIAALICYGFYGKESRWLARPQAIALVILIFLLTNFLNNLHHFYVDSASDWGPSNTAWQERLQTLVVQLSPAVAPHSYRFLPNGIVLWMQICRVRFDTARDIYRLLVGLLLFYAIYRYARLYTDYMGGILAMLLVAVVYPISFEIYAGQLTDPVSHLSFVLAFIFLETENFPFLLTTLLIGSLAKETVLVLCGFYVVFCRGERKYVSKAVALCVASLAAYFGVRFFVLNGTIHYGQISGVTPDHISANWRHAEWPSLFLITTGSYVPFLALGWKETPRSLKRMVFYLVPLLFTSSLLFSWLMESRNYMPVVFVLAVVAARYLTRHSGSTYAV